MHLKPSHAVPATQRDTGSSPDASLLFHDVANMLGKAVKYGLSVYASATDIENPNEGSDCRQGHIVAIWGVMENPPLSLILCLSK